jgi:alpha-glucosidase
MVRSKFLVCLLPLLMGAAHAQDPRSIVSPDGQLAFHLFTFLPEGNGLNTLAYQVLLRGKPLIDTSALGMSIHFQEPMLGENVGLSGEKWQHEPAYNGLLADYLQNSSTGRRIQIEVRVWNDGVAFRYLIPPQATQVDLLIEDDATEFHLAQDPIGGLPEKAPLPFLWQVAGADWAGIFEGHLANFPAMSLVRSDAHTMMAHVPDKPGDPGVAFAGVPPWTGPWHVIAVGTSRERVAESQAVKATR